MLRKQYDASTAFDVECMPVEEVRPFRALSVISAPPCADCLPAGWLRSSCQYLARFSSLILTTSGLTCDGMDSTDLLSLAAA